MLVAVSEARKSHFIEKSHLLQGFDVTTIKLTKTHSMAQTSIPCSAGELLPAAQREGVISFGPYRWPPSAPTTKSRDAVSCSLCCHLGPRRSPHRFTPIDMTAVLWGGPIKKVYSPHWDVSVAYSVNSSPDAKIPPRPARRHQHPCY